eukprot:TRINITY_DN23716_c0_g1_i1.p1 TRINITY_DN23716_c0_g1~~TRINITY_DN23716_c0_g1_i1.p1  ORF type:complete len:395 (-),score=34.32 TRINITY_DN23716_c0_g1_i1:14-1165(-)
MNMYRGGHTPGRLHQPSENATSCRRPCNGRCYVCNPYGNGKKEFYIFLEEKRDGQLVFQHCFLNQNFRRHQELILVPQVHVGEFRLLDRQQAAAFWSDAARVLARLVQIRAKDLGIEINYGNWIVHQSSCPHYHAHVHIKFSNYEKVMGIIQERRFLNTAINTVVKGQYETDRYFDLTDLVASLPLQGADRSFIALLNADPSQAKFIFEAVYDWLGRYLPGFGFVIRRLDDPAGSSYSIRIDDKNAARAEHLLGQLRSTLPPRAAVASHQPHAAAHPLSATDKPNSLAPSADFYRPASSSGNQPNAVLDGYGLLPASVTQPANDPPMPSRTMPEVATAYMSGLRTDKRPAEFSHEEVAITGDASALGDSMTGSNFTDGKRAKR